MEVHQILAKLEKRYRECSSYSDVGRVDFFDIDKKIEYLEFKTQFVRPNYYRFECHDYGPNRGKSGETFCVISNGYSTVFKHYGEKRDIASLQNGVASATGCSAGAALVTPALLIDWKKVPGMQGPFGSVLQLQEPMILRSEIFDGDECFVLGGELYGNRHLIWIAKRDFTLKRVFRNIFQLAPSTTATLPEQAGTDDFQIQMLEQRKALPNDLKDPDILCWSSLYTFRQAVFDAQIDPDVFRHTLQ